MSVSEFSQQLNELEKEGQITPEEHTSLLELYLERSRQIG